MWGGTRIYTRKFFVLSLRQHCLGWILCVNRRRRKTKKQTDKNQSCTVATCHQGFAQQRLQILQLWRELESVNHGGLFFFFFCMYLCLPSPIYVRDKVIRCAWISDAPSMNSWVGSERLSIILQSVWLIFATIPCKTQPGWHNFSRTNLSFKWNTCAKDSNGAAISCKCVTSNVLSSRLVAPHFTFQNRICVKVPVVRTLLAWKTGTWRLSPLRVVEGRAPKAFHYHGVRAHSRIDPMSKGNEGWKLARPITLCNRAFDLVNRKIDEYWDNRWDSIFGQGCNI